MSKKAKENREYQEAIEADVMVDEVSKASRKAKHKPEDLHRWLGHARIERNGKWYIIVSNNVQNSWTCIEELEGYPHHTLRDAVLLQYNFIISNEEMRNIQKNMR